MDHAGVRVRRGVDLSEVDLPHDREVERDIRHLGSIPRAIAEQIVVDRTHEG